MSDEQIPLTATDEKPGAGTAPAGGAPAPAPGPSPDTERLATLERELATERGRRSALEETLTALRPQQPQGGGRRANIPAPSREQVERIAETTGYTPEQIRESWGPMTAFFAEIAGPVLGGLDALADRVDLVDTRQEVPEYGTIKDRAEALRLEHQRRGEFISRKAAAALVKAHDRETAANDPQARDKQLAEWLKEKQDREASASAAVTERGGGTGGARGSSRAGSAPSKEEFERLSTAEQEKLLAGVTF